MFPKVIYTPRLFLRPLVPEDAQHLRDAVSQSLSTLTQWMDWAQDPFLLTHASYRIETHNRQRPLIQGSQYYGIFLKESDALIGEISVHHRNFDENSAQLGYWMSQIYQGQGLMREVVIVMSLYLFEYQLLSKLQVYCERGNERSIQLAKTLGFSLETILPHFTINLTTNTPNDVFVFLRTDANDFPKLNWSFF